MKEVLTTPAAEETQAEVRKMLRDLLTALESGVATVTEYVHCSMVPGTLAVSWVPVDRRKS